jgi:hypothetical protein
MEMGADKLKDQIVTRTSGALLHFVNCLWPAWLILKQHLEKLRYRQVTVKLLNSPIGLMQYQKLWKIDISYFLPTLPINEYLSRYSSLIARCTNIEQLGVL